MRKNNNSLGNSSFIQQRRAELVCDDNWISDFLIQAQIGHIATRWNDQPFITPTTYWFDKNRMEIYFHSNIVGRVRANAEQHEQVCFETCEVGKLLPSNTALEFSIQYASVIVFGRIQIVEELEEQRRILGGLITKYFPAMRSGEHYRPITDLELRRTSVYAIHIDEWSGKRNWPDKAKQSSKWALLDI